MRRLLFIVVCLACLEAACASLAHSATVYGVDLHSRPITQLTIPKSQAVVLLFLATDCPISNRYIPEILKLKQEFAGRNAAFWLVYPNTGETAETVRQNQAAFGINGPTLLHPTPQLMALAPATLTPESAVLVPAKSSREELHSVYTGRLDDRYLSIGRQRPQATRHDLAEAINAVLQHQPVPMPGGPPVGCGIIRPSAMQSGAGKP